MWRRHATLGRRGAYRGEGGQHGRQGHMRRALTGFVGGALLLLAIPGVAEAKPATTGLALTPRVKVIRATWSVTESQRVIGWRLKWRPVTEPASKWTTRKPDLPASAREDIFTQL